MRTHSPWLPCGLLLIFLPGCGGSPTTPSSPAPSTPPTLQPGAYYFLVSQGSNSTNAWICLGVGSYPAAVRVPVIVQGEGGSYQAQAVNGSLLLRIAVSGSTASGTVQGSADDGTGAFALSVQGTEPVGISGSVTSDHTASGSVEGNISLIGPHGHGGCSPTSWSLMPR